MNRKEAASLLNISIRTLERRVREGKIKVQRHGRCCEFSFSDLGLPTPEPKAQPTPHAVSAEPAPTINAEPTIEELDGWTDEELREGTKRWHLPADVNGIPTSVPHEHSSTQPSPQNFALLIRANAILEVRRFTGSPNPIKSAPGRAISVGMLGPANSPYSFRPHTGYGLTVEDLEAESLTLLQHPQFGRGRYSR